MDTKCIKILSVWGSFLSPLCSGDFGEVPELIQKGEGMTGTNKKKKNQFQGHCEYVDHEDWPVISTTLEQQWSSCFSSQKGKLNYCEQPSFITVSSISEASAFQKLAQTSIPFGHFYQECHIYLSWDTDAYKVIPCIPASCLSRPS